METSARSTRRIDKQTYTVAEIATILGISKRAAYNFCHKTKDLRVMRLGNIIRVHQYSFEQWFYKS